MVLKSIVSVILLATTVGAAADCYYSSATTTININDKVQDVDSVNTMYGNGTCTVTARVLHRGSWHSIAGTAKNPNIDTQELCMTALEFGVRDYLLRANNKRIEAEQITVCTDLPTPKLRPVQKGDVIKISEVQPHPTRPPFLNHGNECRWFIEGEVDHVGRLQTINGVVCKVGRLDADKWYVVEKRLD